MVQELCDVIKHIAASPWLAIVSSFVTFLLGIPVGIYLERRKEYNELAEPLHLKCAAGCIGIFYIAKSTRLGLRRRMGWLQRRRFDAALADFDAAAAQTTQNEAGQVHFTNVDTVNVSLQKIANVLKRK